MNIYAHPAARVLSDSFLVYGQAAALVSWLGGASPVQFRGQFTYLGRFLGSGDRGSQDSVLISNPTIPW